MQVEIKAVLPIKHPMYISPGCPRDQEACHMDFLDSAAEVLKRSNPNIKKCKVTKLTDASKVPPSVWLANLSEMPLSVLPRLFYVVVFDLGYEIDEKKLSEMNAGKEFGIQEIESIWASIADSQIADLLLLAAIAYPGRFHTGTGYTSIGEDCMMNRIAPMRGMLLNHFDSSQTWPLITHLPLSEVARWEKKLGLLEGGIGDTAIKRALASFTHIQHCNGTRQYSQLFYAMQGLEAFYCRGSGELRRQLSEKCKLFLGSWPVSKNIVGKAYDLRSSFVHGDFPIECHGFDGEASEEVEKASRDLSDATTLAVRLLTATLHKCVREQITEVDFKWQITTS